MSAGRAAIKRKVLNEYWFSKFCSRRSDDDALHARCYAQAEEDLEATARVAGLKISEIINDSEFSEIIGNTYDNPELLKA